MNVKQLLLLCTLLLFTSCDPFHEENIILVNDTSKDLKFRAVVNKADTTYLFQFWNNRNFASIINEDSTTMEFELNVLSGEKFNVFLHSGVGYADIIDSKTANKYMKFYYDTIYLKSPNPKIEVFDFDLWDIQFNSKKNPTFTSFTLKLTDKDIE